ncbi:hypothetical protein IFM89_031934 [Coptis chinensis]|uniref:SWIM-type domain-containing protein n=1 Tax=Coptis chinensis TaxID=261450 RepID=A0A835IRH7_9MAGN|nr:hypothetical protein IFM89_031934 [Coptis chinensis]
MADDEVRNHVDSLWGFFKTPRRRLEGFIVGCQHGRGSSRACIVDAIPEVEVEDPTVEALNAKRKEVVQEEVGRKGKRKQSTPAKRQPTKYAKSGETTKKRKGGRKVKGKGVIVDEDDPFWSNVGTFDVNTYNVLSEDELDDDEGIEVPVVRKVAAKPPPPNVEKLEPEEEYHSAHSSEDELEYMIPSSAEYYNYEGETVDVYRTEANDVRPHIVEDEWERGMEWPNIKILRQEIKDYYIKNRFVGRMVVNESYRILAICEASGCPWRAYWRKKKSDGFTMRLSTFNNEHRCATDTGHKNRMADVVWVATVMLEHMKVHHKTYTPQNIIDDIRQKQHVAISYWTAWSARIRCLQQIHEDFATVLCDQAEDWDINGLVIAVVKKIEKMIEDIPNWDLEASNSSLYCIRDVKSDYRYTVNIVDQECSCRRWQLSGIVCVHAVVILYKMRADWKEYCSSYFWVSTYRMAYKGHIKPMEDPRD